MFPRVLSDLDSANLLLNIYAHLIGFLLGSVGIKYLAFLYTCAFKQHPAVIILFLLAISVYVISNLVLTFRSYPQMNLIIMVCVCHISGIVACELLLLLLSPIWCFLINLSLIVLVFTLLFSYNSLFQPSHPDTETAEGQAVLFSYNSLFQPSHPDTETAEGQAVEMADLEAPPITFTT